MCSETSALGAKSTLNNTKITTTTRPVFFGKTGLKTGFTLVELIVVISILAILATIAFLSFGGFSSKARDGSRISDTVSLSKGLELYQVKSGYYPKPEGTLTEGIINGTLVAYKGEIQDQISSLTKISKTPKDPLSNNYYIYGTTLDYKQYQIATTLENSIAYNKINPITQTTYADGPAYQAKVTGNYKGLLKYTDTSSKTWLSNIPSLIYNSGTNLLDNNTYYSIDKSTNLPYKIQDAVTNNKTADIVVKEITNNTSAVLTKVEITAIKTKEDVATNSTLLSSLGFDASTIEKTVISGNTVIGQSGSVIITISNKFSGEDGIAGTADDCNMDNIKIGTGTATEQIWSACNLGATIAFSGTNAGVYNTPPSTTRGGDDNVNGKLYQWGRNKGFTSNDNTQQSTVLTSNPNGNDIYNFVWNATLTLPYDWISPQNNIIWGGSITDSAIVDGQIDDALRKGPCPTGWHVPSAKDWQDACNSITGITCTAGMLNSTVRTTLLLPIAGNRYWKTGSYEGQGSVGNYWSSSPTAISAFVLLIFNDRIYPTSSSIRSYGNSIRCLKD